MKTKPHTPTTEPNIVMRDDIEDSLARAQALAYVLADAAGGIGVDKKHVEHVAVLIAEEIKEAQELLNRYDGQEKSPQNAKEAA